MSLKATNNVAVNKYELEIEVSAEDFEAALQKAYLKARKNIQMPGFRKGKAPRKLIEREYGEQVFFEDAVNLIYADVVNGAVEESGLTLVARPDVEVTAISKAEGVKIKATCVTKPEVEIKDYKGIEVTKTVKEVTDEDIDAQLNTLREKNVTVETVDDRAAENGDDVVIDFEGFKDGVAFDGGKAEDFTLTLGSGQFIPGFEDQIVGHNTGESFEINVTFPEEYQVEELKGAPAVFKINLKSISKKVLPEIDDEMIKDSTEFETVDEYKEDVKKKLAEANEKQADREVESAIFDVVIEKLEGEIPQEMYDNRVNEMVQELEQRLRAQGMSLDLYMQYTGQSLDTVKKTYEEQANKQVKLRLALEKIAQLENIEVSDEELDEELTKISEQYGVEKDQIKQIVAEEDLRRDVAVGKASELVKDSAVIK
ncbi:MAG: trigger factor [Ruminococcus sp.]|nr:trigger factor [Ruminococcus sp.]